MDDTFSKTGFNNWYKGTESFKKHQLSKSHINSSTSMKSYFNENILSIDILLDKHRTMTLAKKETERVQTENVWKG